MLQRNVMPRTRDQLDDDESTVTISFPHDISASEKSKPERSQSQDDQLARAREVALNNRRRKLRAKLETRLAELRGIMGDLNEEQLERVVENLVLTEDRLRSKLNVLTERHTEELKNIHAEVRRITKLIETGRPSASTSKKVAVPLSSVSSVSTFNSKHG
jgi:C4-dicarboxylate-specific signal transduction histidine kinase